MPPLLLQVECMLNFLAVNIAAMAVDLLLHLFQFTLRVKKRRKIPNRTVDCTDSYGFLWKVDTRAICQRRS